MSEIELTAGNVKAAMKESGASSSDLWMVPRENIRVLDGFNVRTNNAEYAAHVCEIGESILANGYRRDKPLTGYIAREGDANIIYLTDGHSRLAGVDYAIERGAEIKVLPVVTVPAGTTMEDLTVGLVVSNSGKRLAPIEIAAVCKRLIGYSMDEDAIAKRLNLTKGYVQQLLSVAGANKKIRGMVEAGEVSLSNAAEALRKHGGKASEVLGEKLAGAQAEGKAKVTKKTLKGPKRNLLSDGVAWIKGRVLTEGQEATAVALLGVLAGVEEAAILEKLQG